MDKQLTNTILVTGIPRSGTSLIARAIMSSDVFSGGFSARSNYSNIQILEKIVKPFLRGLNADLEGQYPLPNVNTPPINWDQTVPKVLKGDGYKKGTWVYKDARSALVWKAWHNAFPNAKWVIVRRRTGDVVQSCLKTGYMKAFANKKIQKEIGVKTEEEGWLWWIHQYEEKFNEMVQAELNIKVIYPERMVYGDYKQLYELFDWLGVEQPRNIISFIEPLLWKSRMKERS